MAKESECALLCCNDVRGGLPIHTPVTSGHRHGTADTMLFCSPQNYKFISHRSCRRVFCPPCPQLRVYFARRCVGSESEPCWPRLPHWPDPPPLTQPPVSAPQRCSASTDICLSPPHARVALFLTLTPLTGKLHSAIPMFSPGYRTVAAATCDTASVGPGRDPQSGNQLQQSTFPGQ